MNKELPPFHSNGMQYGTGAGGERICLGARQGRISHVPASYRGEKLHLLQVRLDRGGYDKSGAYWGHTDGYLWCAWGRTSVGDLVEVYVRAISRGAAKCKVQRRFEEEEQETPPQFLR